MSLRSSVQTKFGLVLTVMLATAAVTVGGVAAAGGLGSDGNPPVPSPPALKTTALTAIGQGTQQQFTSVTPCRLLDTRKAGGPITNTDRSFVVSGSLTGQGGNSAGCGIPSNASAITINLTGISKYTNVVRGWPYGATPPIATLLNYSPALHASNMVTIPLCRGACAKAFTLHAYNTAHVVGDVLGYYTLPIYGLINSSGGIVNSSSIVGVTHPATGEYDVTFDRVMTGCAINATDEIWATNNDVSPDNPNGKTTVIFKVTDTSNSPVNTWFHFTASC